MQQKKTERFILTPVLRPMSSAFSYVSSSLERLLYYDRDEITELEVFTNLEYAQRELADAHHALRYIGEHIGKDNTANTIDFRNEDLKRAVMKVRISIDCWVHEWTLVEDFGGLVATMEHVATDILDVANKIKKISDQIKNGHETKLAITSMYYDLMVEISGIMRALSVVGLIADMVEALKSGQREASGIMIPLKGENLMGKVHSRQVVNAST